MSWKDMKMIFDRTPMRDALRMLGKRYNVDFIVNTSKYDKYTFTGMFTDQYVDEILKTLKFHHAFVGGSLRQKITIRRSGL